MLSTRHTTLLTPQDPTVNSSLILCSHSFFPLVSPQAADKTTKSADKAATGVTKAAKDTSKAVKKAVSGAKEEKKDNKRLKEVAAAVPSVVIAVTGMPRGGGAEACACVGAVEHISCLGWGEVPGTGSSVQSRRGGVNKARAGGAKEAKKDNERLK
jgi:hypothetical protein